MIPASSAQRELWHLDRYDKAGATLNVTVGWRITGDLDVAALTEAVRSVLGRHEALRTAFREVDGAPMLEVMSVPEDCLETVTARDLDDAANRLGDFCERPLDLSAGKVAAAQLVRLAEDDHVLGFCFHHAAVDAWSLGIVESELGESYRAARAGVQVGRAPRYRLRDVMEVLNSVKETPRWSEDLDYWAAELASPPGQPGLPGSTTVDGYQSGHARHRLPGATEHRLRELSRNSGSTLFQLLLAAYAGTIGRWANTRDYILGVPVADRLAPELIDAVLFATNVLPVRVTLDADPSYTRLADSIKRRLIMAVSHAAPPVSDIARRVKAGSGQDLVGICVSHRQGTGTTLRLEGAECAPYRMNSTRSLYQLACHVEQNADGIWLELEGRALTSVQLEELWDRLEAVFEFVAREPDAPVSAWPILLPSDRLAWHGPAIANHASETVVDAFLQQAAQTPERVAVVDWEGSYSYSELRDAVEAVAGALIDAGARPGDVVAVAAERSVAATSGLLGIMFAGCTYLPVDLRWPPARMSLVLRDAGARLVVCDGVDTHHDGLGGLTRISARHGRRAGAPAVPRAFSGDHAYLLYTSGSTGEPKGVMVGHAALSWLLAAVAEVTAARSIARVLASTSTTFDISLVELLLPVTTGATCVIARQDVVLDTMRLAAFIAGHRIDFVQGTPTLWSALVEHLQHHNVRVPVAVCAGEPLNEALRDQLLKLADVAYNGYGPTEATVYATFWRLEPDVPVSIGQPLPGVSAHVLDRWNRPCARGALGQLVLGGAGVASGYHHREALTAEVFREDLPATAARRVYLTGDLAHVAEDGLIYLHGREDDQVKLRGFRIELAEIESVLMQVAGVAEAAVTPMVLGSDQKSLIAYVRLATASPEVPAVESAALDPVLDADIRRILRERLPEYMRPRQVFPIDAMPRTSSGKIDRRALRERAEAGQAETASAKQEGELSSPLQRQIVALWHDQLGPVRITSGDEDFFALGGDSIGAARLLARLRNMLEVPVSMDDFLDEPSINRLVRLVGPRAFDEARSSG